MSHDESDAPTATSEVFPSVSVVVPAYNSAAYLPRCLSSLTSQRYPRDRYEVIVVDDGSTDDTARIAHEIAHAWDGHMIVLRESNGGPASARNAGISASAAPLVAFIDADCVADPDWLSALVGALDEAEANAAGVGGPIINVAPRDWVSRYLDACSFYRHRMRDGRVEYLLTQNVAFRRSALLQMGGFVAREGVWAEDSDLSFRLTQAGYSLLLSERGAVTHYGSPTSVRDLWKKLYLYGIGNAALGANWGKRRAPGRELVRRAGAVVLAPALALRLARRAGIAQALSFIPLISIEHTAFGVGLIAGMRHVAERGGSAGGREVHQRHYARAK